MGRYKHWVRVGVDGEIIASWMTTSDQPPVPDAVRVPDETPQAEKNEVRKRAGKRHYFEDGGVCSKRKLDLPRRIKVVGEATIPGLADCRFKLDGKQHRGDGQAVKLKSTQKGRVTIEVDDPRAYCDHAVVVEFE